MAASGEQIHLRQGVKFAGRAIFSHPQIRLTAKSAKWA
jgi:hypothetical protein